MWPSTPWTRIHINFAEQGKQNILIVVDAHSHWPEVFAMKHREPSGISETVQTGKDRDTEQLSDDNVTDESPNTHSSSQPTACQRSTCIVKPPDYLIESMP